MSGRSTPIRRTLSPRPAAVLSPRPMTPVRATTPRGTPVTPMMERSFGRRLAPSSYRHSDAEVHMGLISASGSPLKGGRGRSNTPTDSRGRVIAPTALEAGERADPLMFINQRGSPVVMRGLGQSPAPTTREYRDETRRHLDPPPQKVNVFNVIPEPNLPRHPCHPPKTSDIPGLADAPTEERAKSPRPLRRTLDGPPVFVPPPFEKKPHILQKRPVVSRALDNDVFLRENLTPTRLAAESPRRTGLRSVTPTSQVRYNIITNQPF